VTAPFKPRRADGRAVWRVGFDYITEGLDHGGIRDGDLLTHDQLTEAMEIEQGSYYYGTLSKVRTELQKERNRDLVPVKGKGYQLVSGLAQVDHGKAQHRSARRKMSKALVTVDTADLTTLSPSQQRDVGLLLRGMKFMSQILGQTVEEVEQHRQDIAELRQARDEAFKRSRATEDDVAAMRARLERVERELDRQ